jgi:hypothetical protein
MLQDEDWGVDVPISTHHDLSVGTIRSCLRSKIRHRASIRLVFRALNHGVFLRAEGLTKHHQDFHRPKIQARWQDNPPPGRQRSKPQVFAATLLP